MTRCRFGGPAVLPRHPAGLADARGRCSNSNRANAINSTCQIVTPLLDRTDDLPVCSAVEALERQEPFINQTLAYHALAILARLFRHGELDYHGS